MPLDLHIHLRDRNPALVSAWRDAFVECPEVEISQGEILAANTDAIVSPANSFGYMDGGIDLAYVEHFGWDLQHRLQQHIADHHAGELPVGQAVIIETNDAAIPFMVSAPTMRIPMKVSDTLNAYLAFRAALLAVRAHNQSHSIPITALLCPGLGTAIGQMPYKQAAIQMLAAYLIVQRGRTDLHDRARKILLNHAAMMQGESLHTDSQAAP